MGIPIEKKKLLEKVKKLMALSSSPNEHEAALAAERAKEILDKYNLSLSEVEIGEIEDKKYDLGITKVQNWQLNLANCTAKTFNCQSYYTKGYGSMTAKLYFVGNEADVEVVEYFYSYLTRVIRKLTTPHIRSLKIPKEMGPETDWLSPTRFRKKHRFSYYESLVDTLRSKLSTFAKKEGEDSSTSSSTGLTGKEIIKVKKDAVKEYTDNKSLKSRKSRGNSLYAGSYNSGQEKGEEVNLHRGVGGSGKETKLLK